MKEQQAFEILLNADYKQLLLTVALLIIAVVVVKKFLNELVGLFGIETKSMKKEREHKEEMDSIKEQLKELKDKQSDISTRSEENDERINKDMSEIKELLTSHIVASMRSTLWRIHKETTSQGYITRSGLKTFVECGNLYTAAGGDDIYHDKLHPEILKLPVRDDD